MKLDADDIRHIATLARLSLSPAELEMYAEQLSAVLDYVEQLNEVETEGVPETTQVTGLANVFRADESASVSDEQREALLDCFPERSGDVLRVRAVFAQENGAE